MVNCFEELVQEMNQVEVPQSVDTMDLMDPVVLKKMAESVCEKCVLRNAGNTSRFMKCIDCVDGHEWVGMSTNTLPPSIKRSHDEFKTRNDEARMRIASGLSQREVCRMIDFQGVWVDGIEPPEMVL